MEPVLENDSFRLWNGQSGYSVLTDGKRPLLTYVASGFVGVWLPVAQPREDENERRHHEKNGDELWRNPSTPFFSRFCRGPPTPKKPPATQGTPSMLVPSVTTKVYSRVRHCGIATYKNVGMAHKICTSASNVVDKFHQGRLRSYYKEI